MIRRAGWFDLLVVVLCWAMIGAAVALATNPVGTRKTQGGRNVINPLTQSPVVFLRSDTLAGSDGSSVTTWPDSSGNGYDATQATAGSKPVLRRTGANISTSGKPLVEFDGNDDWLANATLPGAGVLSTANGATFYFYFNQISLTNSSAFDLQQLFDCGAGASILELVADTSTDVGVGWPDDFIGTNTSTVRDLFGAAQTGCQVLTFEFVGPPAAGATYRAYRNGVQIGVDETNWQFTDIRGGYGLGNTGALNTGWRGAMGALLIYNTQHSAKTRQGIINYLTSTFGL